MAAQLPFKWLWQLFSYCPELTWCLSTALLVPPPTSVHLVDGCVQPITAFPTPESPKSTQPRPDPSAASLS